MRSYSEKVFFKHILSGILCFCVAISIMGCGKKNEEQEIPYEKQQMITEIGSLEELLSSSILSEKYDAEGLEKIIERIKDEDLNSLDIFYTLREEMNKYNCGHLVVVPTNETDEEFCEGQFFPILALAFEDGYHLFATSESYTDYLGMRFISLGGAAMDEVNSRLAKYITCETKSALDAAFDYRGKDSILFCRETFERCGLVNERGQLEAVLRDEKGIDHTVCFEGYPFSVIGEFRFLEAVGTRHIRDCFNGQKYCCYGDRTAGVMYFDYFSCEDRSDISFEGFFSDMIRELKEDDAYDTIVFDVRDNTGGNRMLARKMLERYGEDLKKYDVKAVTGSTTFSSGYFFIEDLLEFVGDVTFYGVETGQSIENYTEIAYAEFPHLGIVLVYPTVKQDAPMIEKKCKDHTGGFVPDVIVYQTYEDYLSGVDSVYKAMEK